MMLSGGAKPDLTDYEFDAGSQPKRIPDFEWDLARKRSGIYQEIENERHRQDEEWGGPEHDDKHGIRDWLSFIVVYLGQGVNRDSDWGRKLSISRYALIQVAALAVAAVEAFDRRIAKGGLE